MTAKRIGFVMLLAPFLYLAFLLICAFAAQLPEILLPIPFFEVEAGLVLYLVELALGIVAIATTFVAMSYFVDRGWRDAFKCVIVFAMAYALAFFTYHRPAMISHEAADSSAVWKMLTIGGVVLNWIALGLGLMKKR